MNDLENWISALKIGSDSANRGEAFSMISSNSVSVIGQTQRIWKILLLHCKIEKGKKLKFKNYSLYRSFALMT